MTSKVTGSHVLGPVAMELERLRDTELLRRNVGVVLAVEAYVRHFADSQHGHCLQPKSPALVPGAAPA